MVDRFEALVNFAEGNVFLRLGACSLRPKCKPRCTFFLPQPSAQQCWTGAPYIRSSIVIVRALCEILLCGTEELFVFDANIDCFPEGNAQCVVKKPATESTQLKWVLALSR